MAQIYKNILLATDGSKEATAAFKRAVAIALENPDATLNIANVINTAALGTFGFSISQSTLEDLAVQSLKSLADLRKQARQAGVKHTEAILQYGSPRRRISFIIPKQRKIDLIVLGATGVSGFSRLMVGSVTDFVMVHAQPDVLVVR